MRIETATLAALATLLASTTAHSTPSARLVYSRAHGAESCPDEAALRTAVAERVGYDPFFAWAKQTVVAAIAPETGGFAARVSLVDEQGMDHGTRTLHMPGECAELIDVAALAIAIAIDPRSLMPHPPPVPEAAEVAKPVASEPPATHRPEPRVEAAPEPPRAPALAVDGTAGGVASFGAAMSPVFGGALGVAVRSGRLSLGLEGRVDVPAAVSARGGGSLSSQGFVASLVPCLRLGRVFVCAVGQLGRETDASQGVVDARSRSSTWLAAGARFGVEVPLQEALALRVRSDVLADLLRRPLEFDGVTDYWTAPIVSTSLGVDVVVHF